MKLLQKLIIPLEIMLMWGGVISGFGIVALVLVFELDESAMRTVGWSFFTVGLGVLLPTFLARLVWTQASGYIDRVDNSSEEQTVYFTYELGGTAHVGEFTETGYKKAGGHVVLLVNPARPDQYLPISWGRRIVGVAFVLFCPALALSDIPFGS